MIYGGVSANRKDVSDFLCRRRHCISLEIAFKLPIQPDSIGDVAVARDLISGRHSSRQGSLGEMGSIFSQNSNQHGITCMLRTFCRLKYNSRAETIRYGQVYALKLLFAVRRPFRSGRYQDILNTTFGKQMSVASILHPSEIISFVE